MDEDMIDILQDTKNYSQKDIENAYYYLMISDWGKIVLGDLLFKFDPLAELHTPGDSHTTAYANGTVAPVKYMLSCIKRMKHHPDMEDISKTIADDSDEITN